MNKKTLKRLLHIFGLVAILTLTNVSAATGNSLPDTAYITGVVGHAQGYSLSCESRSAADWAAFWGVSISEEEFLNALPRADDPDEGFVGEPNDTWGFIPPKGYGVHAGPVAVTLQGFGLEAEAYRELGWDDLRQELDAGRPVIVWVIGQMWGGNAVRYEAPDGSTSTVAPYEHTMILTGYSPEAVQVVDAYTGQYQSYGLKTFLKSWGVLGNMAILGSAEPVQYADTAPPVGMESYTVLPGEYLVGLAERFGTTWQELAELNSIGYPYTIYPGQVLQLPASQESPDAQAEEAEAQPEPTELPPATTGENYQAVLPVVQRNFAGPLAPSDQTPGETVTVARVQSLISYGKTIGVDWRLLIKLNNLRPPYLVFPGQVLKLK